MIVLFMALLAFLLVVTFVAGCGLALKIARGQQVTAENLLIMSLYVFLDIGLMCLILGIV